MARTRRTQALLAIAIWLTLIALMKLVEVM
jgi:hypothetical protein